MAYEPPPSDDPFDGVVRPAAFFHPVRTGHPFDPLLMDVDYLVENEQRVNRKEQ